MSKAGIEREAGVETAGEVRRVETAVKRLQTDLEDVVTRIFDIEPRLVEPGDLSIAAAATDYPAAFLRPPVSMAGGTLLLFRATLRPGVDTTGSLATLTLTAKRSGFEIRAYDLKFAIPTATGPDVPITFIFADTRDRTSRPGYAVVVSADAVGDTTPPALTGIALISQP